MMVLTASAQGQRHSQTDPSERLLLSILYCTLHFLVGDHTLLLPIHLLRRTSILIFGLIRWTSPPRLGVSNLPDECLGNLPWTAYSMVNSSREKRFRQMRRLKDGCGALSHLTITKLERLRCYRKILVVLLILHWKFMARTMCGWQVSYTCSWGCFIHLLMWCLRRIDHSFPDQCTYRKCLRSPAFL